MSALTIDSEWRKNRASRASVRVTAIDESQGIVEYEFLGGQAKGRIMTHQITEFKWRYSRVV